MRVPLVKAVVAFALVASACSAGPTPSGRPTVAPLGTLEPAQLPAGAVRWPRGTLLEDIVPHVGDPTGPPLALNDDAAPDSVEAGRGLTIVSPPTAGPGGPWVEAWIDDSAERSPSMLLAWFPTHVDGRDVLRIDPAEPCPRTATLAALVVLSPFDRLRCVGSQEVAIDARPAYAPLAPMYDTDPAWFGRNDDPGVTLYDPGPVPIGPGAILSPETARAWLDARIPPGVAGPPVGFWVRVHGHFDDPAAIGCRRTVAWAPAAAKGLPVEDAMTSRDWCRSQFVVSAWEPLLGPEGRPIDLEAPQLHRREFVAPPGAHSSAAVSACPR